MATMSEDLDTQVNALKDSVTSRDALRAARHLMRIGGEISGLVTVIWLAFWGAGVVGWLLGPIGLAIPTVAVLQAVHGIVGIYDSLDTEDRRQVRHLLAFVRRVVTIA